MADVAAPISRPLSDAVEKMVHPRYGLVRDIVEFPLPPGFPPFFQISAPLSNAAADHGTEAAGLRNLHGAALETDRDVAITVALAEAAERYAGALLPASETIDATGDELGAAARHCEDLILFNDTTYRAVGCPWSPYDPRRVRSWVPAFDAETGERQYLPAQIVVFDYRSTRAGEALLPSTTSGLASGRSGAAAAVSGLCEIVERDAFVCHWLLRRSPKPIRLEPGDVEALDPTLGHLFRNRSVDIGALWLESDIRLPIVLGYVRAASGSMVSVGAACRLDAGDALRKALLEAVHSWLYVTELRLRNVEPIDADQVRSFLDHAAYYRAADRVASLDWFLRPAADPEPLGCLSGGLDLTPDLRNQPLDARLGLVTERIAAAGFRPLLSDRTSPDVAELGYAVVRAVIPGLQPIFTGIRWIPDDRRRIDAVARRWSIGVPSPLPREPHPFP